MSNRHVWELSQVYEHLFRDARYAFPTLSDEFRKDLARLQESVKQRGLHVYFVDLPAVGKHLDRCLADGEYKLSGLALTGRFSNRVVIPKFLRGLYLLVFDELGHLRKDTDHAAIFFLRQILYAAKKADFDCGRNSEEQEYLSFVAVDGLLPRPERFWEVVAPTCEDVESTYPSWVRSNHMCRRILGEDFGVSPKSLTSFLTVLDFVSSQVCFALGEYNPIEWKHKHGPGAISEVTGPTNKYSWRNWSDRLEAVFPIADCGFYNHASWAAAAADSSISSCEPYSRMVAVPKSYTKPRLIAAEPSEHQWCQQNLWHYFRSRAERSWISKFVRFTDQTRNQELCLRGSKDGALSTVDLSAASDRVTCHAVGLMFRSNPKLLLALQATRTRFVQQRLTTKSPEMLELNKFSTMGSACTFPVESLLFLAVTLASVIVRRQMPVTLRSIISLAEEVAVFGDDIIVPTDSRQLLFGTLKLLFFEVNTDKSFWSGNFRESCGVDAYAGTIITPAFWRGPNGGDPESIASTVEVRNNFYSKFLLHTAQYLASTIPRAGMPNVGMDSGVLGLKSRVKPIPNTHLKRRWNIELQRTECLILQLSAVVKRTPVDDDSALLQFFTEAPDPFTKWISGITQRPQSRMRLGWVSMHDLEGLAKSP
jgi:hypothetical protein